MRGMQPEVHVMIGVVLGYAHHYERKAMAAILYSKGFASMALTL